MIYAKNECLFEIFLVVIAPILTHCKCSNIETIVYINIFNIAQDMAKCGKVLLDARQNNSLKCIKITAFGETLHVLSCTKIVIV